MTDTTTRRRALSDNTILFLMALLAAGVLLQTAHQTLRLNADSVNLEARYTAQQTALEDVTRVRAQLESLAGQTAVLAERGNANALQLQEQLRTQGVTIRPPQ